MIGQLDKMKKKMTFTPHESALNQHFYNPQDERSLPGFHSLPQNEVSGMDWNNGILNW